MDKLTCICGNSDVFDNLTQVNDKQTAVCGVCGETVTHTGGVRVQTVTGGMHMTHTAVASGSSTVIQVAGTVSGGITFSRGGSA